MHICYLINSLQHGGAENLLLDLIQYTDNQGIATTVCYLENEDSLLEELQETNARTICFNMESKFDIEAIVDLLNFFRGESFDVLHAHLPYSQVLARICGRLGGVDTIISTQHNMSNNYHYLTRFLERTTRFLDSSTIAVSDGVKNSFDEAYPIPLLTEEWRTIYNGIDAKEFNDNVGLQGSDNIAGTLGIKGNYVFLNVARYVPVKSQTNLILAMENVVQEWPDSHLVIVGWGEEEENLRETVKSRGLSDSVTITGRVPSVHPYYAIADTFVSSSLVEGMPITILEAMAAELPVIATDIPGVREVVIHRKTGRLVSRNSPNELAEAMIHARAEHDWHRLGQAGYDRVQQKFSIQNTARAYMECYRDQMSENV